MCRARRARNTMAVPLTAPLSTPLTGDASNSTPSSSSSCPPPSKAVPSEKSKTTTRCSLSLLPRRHRGPADQHDPAISRQTNHHTHLRPQLLPISFPTLHMSLREQIAARRAEARASPARPKRGAVPVAELEDKTVRGQVGRAARSGE